MSEAIEWLMAVIAENERLRERLEIAYVWRSLRGGPLERVRWPKELPITDGIECRDETILLQAERIAKLEEENEHLNCVIAIRTAQLQDAEEALANGG